MDPLIEILPEIQDLIFQHCNCDDLLESSTVSKLWYKVIGSSFNFKSKVWVNAGDRCNEPSRSDVKSFRVSSRKYENFKISEMENGLQILLFPRRKWRRAKIDIQSFMSFKEYIDLLELVNDDVLDLEIFDMHIDNESDDCREKNLIFNSLIKLKISSVTIGAVMPFIQPLKNLRKLIIDEVQMENENILSNFISQQSNLTHLGLSSKLFIALVKSSSNCTFKLEFLHVEQNQEFPKSDDVALSNLRLFVSHQARLKWLVLSDWSDDGSFIVFFSLPKLERISIEYFDADVKKVVLDKFSPKCQTLIRIDFECENASVEWIKSIIKGLADIKFVYFFHISMDLLKLLSERKTLESIKFCSIFDDHEKCITFLENRHLKLEEEKYFDYRNII